MSTEATPCRCRRIRPRRGSLRSLPTHRPTCYASKRRREIVRSSPTCSTQCIRYGCSHDPSSDCSQNTRLSISSICAGIDPTMSFLLMLLSISVVPSGQSFACTPTAVWDGDGPVWCDEGPRLRLAGIAARELDGSCSSGHPCPSADPHASRDALVALLGTPIGEGRLGHVLVRGPTMRCVSTGSAGGNRTGAWCVSPKSGDVNCRMVSDGSAALWRRYWGDHRCS